VHDAEKVFLMSVVLVIKRLEVSLVINILNKIKVNVGIEFVTDRSFDVLLLSYIFNCKQK